MAESEDIPQDVLASVEELGAPATDRLSAGSSGPILYPGELISAASALVLAVMMFEFEWFGFNSRPGHGAIGSGVASAENAWNGMHLVRWVMLLTIGIAVFSVLLHYRQRNHGTKTSTGGALTALGGVTVVLLIIRVLIDPPSPDRVVDQKLGALVGLFSALGIAYGGYETMRAERNERRQLVKRIE